MKSLGKNPVALGACALLAVIATPARADLAETPVEGELTEIQVTARRLDEARNQLMPEVGASEYRLGTEDLKNLPLGESTPLNQVLLRAPGVTQDSFGQLHVRGDHANLQYRINDVVIPESIALFGQALNPRFANEISLLTGVLPAQYGYRTAGVVDIHTKGSQYRNGAELGGMTGTSGHLELNAEVSGAREAWSYYATAGHLSNDLGIENPQPTAKALHDHTDQWNGFAYLAHVLPNAARISFMSGWTDDAFQIPVRPGQAADFVPPGTTARDAAALDQRQREGNRYAVLAYENAPGSQVHYQVALYDRDSAVHYFPDPEGDLAYTGAAGDIARSNRRRGLQFDASGAGERHTIRAGFTVHEETARTQASTAVYPLDPYGAPIFQVVTIDERAATRSRLWGGYLQDEWHPVERWTVNVGTRFDRADSVLSESQWSPRLGIVVELDGGVTLHAGYARYFTPPPTEKISSQSVSLFTGTTGAPPSTENAPVRSERSHYWDLGVMATMSPHLTVGIDGYYRKVKDLGDEGQFGPAVLFSPFNYAQGRIVGIETTINWRHDLTNAYLNVAWGNAQAKGIVTGQYNFAEDEIAALSRQWIPLDHDQRWTLSGGIARSWGSSNLSLDVIAGTGLRSGNLNADHLPGYAVFNFAIRRTVDTRIFGEVEWSLSVINLLDRVYELRDGTGVGVGAPQWGQRRCVYLGFSRAFGG